MSRLLAAIFVVAVCWTSMVQSVESRQRWVTTTALSIGAKAHNACARNQGAGTLRVCLDRVVSAAARTTVRALCAGTPFGTSAQDLSTIVKERAIGYALAYKGIT